MWSGLNTKHGSHTQIMCSQYTRSSQFYQYDVLAASERGEGRGTTEFSSKLTIKVESRTLSCPNDQPRRLSGFFKIKLWGMIPNICFTIYFLFEAAPILIRKCHLGKQCLSTKRHSANITIVTMALLYLGNLNSWSDHLTHLSLSFTEGKTFADW